ncbi:MAG TPA: Asp-tRNA(Asn)/Glu-tRNA(Gln) amidotransferase subunit GatC [Thermoleophilia bacterium]|nr:Asp-tRNA(Asn)/Glu-tRNA(Gln) amidotransferase subunit GatC [Acidobacteriota bacterium]NLT92487.1 Asp-tRNA(Asn)/Glu-tRNA(Gln) amidotransferase subunit GatC [Actinomycetota bacterium]HOU28150.1 Asp-tRNA(Asn)/Glu-tRNA(Gln) amidotransferase subunit GatC [Thermoleophilia bacterium]HQF52520.1 Asp-tRNA(Asn)/Glu-tRNA(Gln) amidotransferase subunit GatC [Thermoleophilia bacterium]
MISEDDVLHVARLARLRVTSEERATMAGELARILAHVGKMSEIDVTGVRPTAHVLDVVNVTREDKRRPGLTRDEALRNAPAVSDDCFRVPRMG